MESSDDAFGLLSLDWSGEPVDLTASEKGLVRNSAAPSVRALYGAGLLRLCAGNVYARVLAYLDTPESKAAVLTIGRSVASGRSLPTEPELPGILPGKIGENWQLQQDKTVFFRSHLILNSNYYLSHQNILNLDHKAAAVTSLYEKKQDKGSSELSMI